MHEILTRLTQERETPVVIECEIRQEGLVPVAFVSDNFVLARYKAEINQPHGAGSCLDLALEAERLPLYHYSKAKKKSTAYT